MWFRNELSSLAEVSLYSVLATDRTRGLLTTNARYIVTSFSSGTRDFCLLRTGTQSHIQRVSRSKRPDREAYPSLPLSSYNACIFIANRSFDLATCRRTASLCGCIKYVNNQQINFNYNDVFVFLIFSPTCFGQ